MADQHTLHAQVLTPEGQVFEGDVQQLSTRTAVGEIGILANHVPVLARLRPTELRLQHLRRRGKRYAQAEGWLQVFANQALVLVGEACRPTELDDGHAERAPSRTPSSAHDEAEEGSAAYAAPSGTASAPRRSWMSPAIQPRLTAKQPLCAPLSGRPLRSPDGRARPHREADRLRHLLAGGTAPCRRVRRRLARSRATSRRAERATRPARDDGRGRPRGRAHAGPARPPRRRPRPSPASSSPASRGTACSAAAPTT